MADRRDQLVKRVVHALDQEQDPESLVRDYFDAERDVVIEATRQTLEATRQEVSADRVAAVVDRELIEALRFPDRPRSALVSLLVHRGVVATTSIAAIVGALLAFLLV